MKDMILFPEDIERLNMVLGPLVVKAKLLLAVCINRDGRVLTHQGSLEQVDIVSLAALVAGNTASTLAIANLVGETEFSTMYHQGKDKNVYIDAIDDNTFLSVVFDDQTNIDRVKVFIRQFERQLKEALHAVYDKDEDQIDLDLDMGGGSFQYIPTDPGQTGTAPYQQKPDYGQQPYGYPQNPEMMQQQTAPQMQGYPAAPPEQYGTDPSQDDAMLYLQNKRRQNPPKKG
ncbi:MAG: roadblock/LC7 domain-containing protein [Chitinispirillaceae bacterium]|nr:roadblock/LC7 domain-containing protein [Chitinispirillaceae bacterium]